MTPRCLATIFFAALVSCGFAFRHEAEGKGQTDLTTDVDDAASHLLTCDWSTCTFEEGAACACENFLEEEGLKEKVRGMMFDVVQTIRRASDKLTPDSGMLQKMLQGAAVSKAQDNWLFLMQAIDSMPDMAAAVQTPVKNLVKEGSFPVPPSMLPVTVELWAAKAPLKDLFASPGEFGDIFIGEAGLTLEPTEWTTGGKVLSLNPHHQRPSGSAQANRPGSVTFGYSVARSAPRPCEDPEAGVPMCVEITLVLKCLSAQDLPDEGALHYPFCKLQVKQDAATLGVVKHKSATVQDDKVNPNFPDVAWTVKWTEPLIEPVLSTPRASEDPPMPVDQLVPWTLDELTFEEQAQMMLYTLSKKVFLDEGKCAGSTGMVKSVCGLLDSFGKMAVDVGKLEQLVTEMDNKGQTSTDPRDKATYNLVKKMAAETEKEEVGSGSIGGGGSSMVQLQEEASLGVGHGAAVHAGRRAHKNRSKPSGGGSSRRRGGSSSGGAWKSIGALLLVFLLVGLAVR